MNLKTIKYILTVFAVVFGIIGVIAFFCVLFNSAYFNTSMGIDTELASKFGDFFGGFVGTIFTVISILVVLLTIVQQSIENKKNAVIASFFKMLDYHNENVKQLNIAHIDISKEGKVEGRRAFVVFKIQIHYLIRLVRRINQENNFNYSEKEIADISYIIFFYGIDTNWIKFITNKLNRYENIIQFIHILHDEIKKDKDLKLGRTNQTSLSSYFRNMYNAIKLIDQDKYLSKREKEQNIKIFRAQLSNPELYVLFFNLISPFGKKWIKEKYITKYEFIKNIPKDYVDGYDPNETFPMEYEEEEL